MVYGFARCYEYIQGSAFQQTLPIDDQYVPSPTNQVYEMLSQAASAGDKHLDLGCGEGLVIGVGLSLGLDSYGCEIDPTLEAIATNDYAGRVTLENWLTVDLSLYDVLTIYAGEASTSAVRERANKVMRAGSRLITFYGIPKVEVL